MESNQPLPPTPASSDNAKTFTIISLVLGVLNLCAWFFPICGFPLGIAGIVLGYLGMKAPEQKNMAIGGMALSGLGILLSCVNAIVGVLFQDEIMQAIERMF